MTVQIKLGGRPIASSRNLRGILDYARRHPVTRVSVHRNDEGGAVYFEFLNGATCHTQFADFNVARNWIMSRRSWDLSSLSYWGHSQTWAIHPGSPIAAVCNQRRA